MLNKIRAWTERLTTSLARGFNAVGFKPEALSLMGLASALLSAFVYNLRYGVWTLYVASALVVLSGLFDMVDGALARLTGKESLLGSFLDSTLDRISDALIIGGLTLSGRVHIAAGVTALAGSLLTSYVRAKAESLGLKMSGVGLVERGERLIIIASAGFLNLLNEGVWILAVLSLLTVAQRITYVLRRLKVKERKAEG